MARHNRTGFRVFRPVATKPDGRKLASCRHHVSFRDHNQTWRRVVAFTDHGASVSYGHKLRELADLRGAGESPRGELARWVNGLDADVLAKLVSWDVLDRRATMALRPLEDHLDAWVESIRADGRTESHITLLRARVEKIIDACGFTRFADINDEVVRQYLAKRQTAKDDPMSVQTRNHYVRAVKQFAAWMVEHGRAHQSPVAKLKMLNVQAGRVRERRALSTADLLHLIQTTDKAPMYGRIGGRERATVFWLAAESGLRASELRSLTASSFDLDASPPTVTIRARAAKNRRQDVLALTDALAARLRSHLKRKLSQAKAFTIPRRTADMLRKDLERAGISYRDEDGAYFDFHSLRVQCASSLARGGAHPAVAQARLRHSSIRLTMDLYTRLGADEQTAALAALPRLTVGA